MPKVKLNENEKNLTRRYLIWAYKTTKESLDKIDRYFTQLNVDEFVLKQLRNKPSHRARSEYKIQVDDFEKYMQKKKKNVLPKKFDDKKSNALQPEYEYLVNRLSALESAIIHFLGRVELDSIIDLYEQEMTRRILEATEH